MDAILEIAKVLTKEERIACFVSQATLIRTENAFLGLVLKQTVLNAAGMGASPARKGLLSLVQSVNLEVVLS